LHIFSVVMFWQFTMHDCSNYDSGQFDVAVCYVFVEYCVILFINIVLCPCWRRRLDALLLLWMLCPFLLSFFVSFHFLTEILGVNRITY